jgi:hypothetical protein
MIKTELKRLAIVKEFELLELDHNKELKDLVNLVAGICNADMATITLIDEDIQWLKCASGITVTQTTRESSFCKHLVNSTNVMVVPDTLLDKRFVNNPLVTGETNIRFYAGAPLITNNGYYLGALCVFDTKPKTLSKRQKEMLTFVARQVMHMMEMMLGLDYFKQHHAEMDLQKAKLLITENKLKAVLNCSKSSTVVISKTLHVLDFNKLSAFAIKALYAKQLQKGKSIIQNIKSSFKIDFFRHIKQALKGKSISKEVLIDSGKNAEWWNIRFEPVQDEFGDTVSVAYSAANINKEKRQVEEINKKNESLLNIAYIQSHLYRKPLASILGLMNVIKENNYESPRECLLLMEKAVNELDKQIKSVVQHSQMEAS